MQNPIVKFQRRRYARLSAQFEELKDLVDGIDERIWPDEYQRARIDCARVAYLRANLGARLHMEA